ncbi:MAG: DUF2142 domain-containing protein [Micromonosporaceae bacterium]
MGPTTLSEQHGGAHDHERHRWRTGWWVSCLAFFLIGAGWAFALPVDGTYDESEHLIRAYGAASGQLYAPPAKAARGGGAFYDVPRSLLPDNVHCPWKGEQPEDKKNASCQHAPPSDTTRVKTGTTAGRYNPVYYLPVGVPMVLLPNTAGIILARLVSSLLSALLLASAVVVALRLRSRLMLAAIVLSTTPMVANLNGSINPNGLEIAAGVLLWATLIALLRTPENAWGERTVRRLLVLGAVAAALLLTVRALGPVWLAGITVFALVAARPGRLAELLRRRDTRLLVGGVGAVAVYAVVWMLVSGALQAVPTRGGSERLEDMVRLMTVGRSSFWTDQIVGQFSYGETTLPSWLIVAWYAMAAALVLPAALLAARRDRWILIGIGLASAFALALFEVAYYKTLNWAQHGRYVMPLGVGLLLLAAVVGRYRTALGTDGRIRLLRMVVVGTAPLHLFALALVMTRFQSGPTSPINPLIGAWLPPFGPVVPLLALTAGVTLLGVYAWRLRVFDSEQPTLTPAAPPTPSP